MSYLIRIISINVHYVFPGDRSVILRRVYLIFVAFAALEISDTLNYSSLGTWQSQAYSGLIRAKRRRSRRNHAKFEGEISSRADGLDFRGR
jgi:hypothetical protein